MKTGYPHIDKPWMKFYDSKKVAFEAPKVNLTEYLKEKNKDRGDKIAETYYGKEISYDEFFYNSDMAARVLSQVGVKKGDSIMNLVPNIPEAGAIWLGATEIGAVSDFIDPRPDNLDVISNAKKVLEVIKHERAKHIVALDMCYLGMLKPIENELKELGIENIIILNASDSMNLSGKIDYLKDVIAYNNLKNIRDDSSSSKIKWYKAVRDKLESMKECNRALEDAIKSSPLNVMKYDDLKKECQNSKIEVVNDPNLINYIGHTSGTSGSRPKPITATNKNGISTLEQLIKGDVSFDAGDSAIHALPFFAPFGAYDNYLLNLVSGANNISVPEFEINEFGYLLKKHKPNILMGTPAWFAAFPECEYLKDMDLSFLKKVIYGGDSLRAKTEEHVNEWLSSHGSPAVLEKGHGMSEFLGCGSYAQKGYNKYDSIGIPLPNTIYTVVDPSVDDKLVPLKFEDDMEVLSGELVVSSDAVTGGMLGDEVIVPHYELDGKSYIRTRDIVDMDRNGIFYHRARKDRSFTRFDGYKIKPYEIESEIVKTDGVTDAALVEYYDDKKRGNMPICHIATKDKLSSSEEVALVEKIVKEGIISNKDMSSRQIPSKFKIRESLPITKNGKTDINELRTEGIDGSEINVDIDETNLSVGEIKIYKNDEKSKVRVR